MSPSIWTRCAGASEVAPWQGSAWRVVEAQHLVSTRALVDDIAEPRWNSAGGDSRSSSFRADSTTVAGERAVVTVVESSFRSSSLFESNAYTMDFDVILAEVDGAWKLRRADTRRYWHPCWSEPETEYCRRRSHVAPAAPGPVAP